MRAMWEQAGTGDADLDYQEPDLGGGDDLSNQPINDDD
jgi:hypothetical protein